MAFDCALDNLRAAWLVRMHSAALQPRMGWPMKLWQPAYLISWMMLLSTSRKQTNSSGRAQTWRSSHAKTIIEYDRLKVEWPIIKQNLFMEAKIRNLLLSQATYSKTKEYRNDILNGDTDTMQAVQVALKRILADKGGSPMQKLLAVKLAKDSIETFNDVYIGLFQKSVLPIFEMVAQFRYDSDDPDRGKFIFSDNPSSELQLIGNSFFRLVLECIWVWSKWFPIDPDTQLLSFYKITFEKLIKVGVRFPKLAYFKTKEVMKEIPESQVPRKMLKQVTSIIVKDMQKNNGVPSSTAFIAERLDLNLKSCVNSFKSDVFYTDVWKRCMRKIKKQMKGETNLEETQKMNKLSYYDRGAMVSSDLSSEVGRLRAENQQLRNQLNEQSKKMAQMQREMDELRRAGNQKDSLVVSQLIHDPVADYALNNQPYRSTYSMRKSEMRSSTLDKRYAGKSGGMGAESQMSQNRNILINLSPQSEYFRDDNKAKSAYTGYGRANNVIQGPGAKTANTLYY